MRQLGFGWLQGLERGWRRRALLALVVCVVTSACSKVEQGTAVGNKLGDLEQGKGPSRLAFIDRSQREPQAPATAPAPALAQSRRPPHGEGGLGLLGGFAPRGLEDAAAGAGASPAPTRLRKGHASSGHGTVFNSGPGASAVGERGVGFRAVPVPAPTRLDPNARYATPYRPGRAARAVLDAAVARGGLPVVYRDLVGAMADAHPSPLALPEQGALRVSVQTERAALAPGGGSLHLRVALRSSELMPTRASLSVHLLIDVSYSMNGAPLEHAKRAAAALVERLRDSDVVSVTTFSDGARVIVPSGRVGQRRSAIEGRLKEIQAVGGTNLSAGLDLAYFEARRATGPADAVRLVLLLSDGQANGGDTAPSALVARAANAFQQGVQTTTFGLGDDFDAPLLGALADHGAGGYYYLADASQLSAALWSELESRLQPVAQGVEVRVRLRPEVVATHVYGSRVLAEREAAAVREQEVAVDVASQRRDGIARDRAFDAKGGMRFFIPSFARADHHNLLLQLRAPAGGARRSLGSVELRYKDRLTGKNVTLEHRIGVTYASSEEESARTADASVLGSVQAAAAGETILRAVGLVEGGARDAAARLLEERAVLLHTAAATLQTPAFAQDARRLTQLAAAVSGQGKVAEGLALGTLLRGAGNTYVR